MSVKFIAITILLSNLLFPSIVIAERDLDIYPYDVYYSITINSIYLKVPNSNNLTLNDSLIITFNSSSTKNIYNNDSEFNRWLSHPDENFTVVFNKITPIYYSESSRYWLRKPEFLPIVFIIDMFAINSATPYRYWSGKIDLPLNTDPNTLCSKMQIQESIVDGFTCPSKLNDSKLTLNFTSRERIYEYTTTNIFSNNSTFTINEIWLIPLILFIWYKKRVTV